MFNKLKSKWKLSEKSGKKPRMNMRIYVLIKWELNGYDMHKKDNKIDKNEYQHYVIQLVIFLELNVNTKY